MSHKLMGMLAGAALASSTLCEFAVAQHKLDFSDEVQISYIAIDNDIFLRRIVSRHTGTKGVVLFLHGFPETLHTWQQVAAELEGEFEIHAFDWPGYGFSSRPSFERFDYSAQAYARILETYIEKAGIDRANLVIYATDIGGLPALLAALENPDIARTIIVGDFAPFDRPEFLQERLQALKTPATREKVREQLNSTRDEILANAMRRGLAPDEEFDLPLSFKMDMASGWSQGTVTSADAFSRYYAQFTRDQNFFEYNIARFDARVQIIWGEKDVYIDKAMGAELAERLRSDFTVLPGIGHYPHLQDPERTAAEIRSAFR